MKAETVALGMLFLLAVALACAVLPATREAGVRRIAEQGLAYCRKGTLTDADAKHCYEEMHDYCHAHGLERTCAEGSP